MTLDLWSLPATEIHIIMFAADEIHITTPRSWFSALTILHQSHYGVFATWFRDNSYHAWCEPHNAQKPGGRSV